MSKPILHAEFLKALLNGEQIEMRLRSNPPNHWFSFCSGNCPLDMFHNPNYDVRIKPKTILINGIEVPEPVRNESQLAEGQLIYIADPNRDSKVDFWRWDQDLKSPRKFLERGLIHLTQEAAEIHARALLSFTTKDE